MYHRVVKAPNDPHLLAVTPEHFAEHLEVICRSFRPMTLEQLTRAVRDGKIPRRGAVITFDDGYADNLYNAKPLLERYGVPATVFVTTGQLDSCCEFWWDELDRLLLQPGSLPERLDLECDGLSQSWELNGARNYGIEAFEAARDWHIERSDNPTVRHSLFRLLYQKLHSAPLGERRRILEELRRWAGTEAEGRSTHRALTRAELPRICDDGLIELGAHTVNHPPLAALSLVEQEPEISASKSCLEEVCDRRVTSLSYPFGSYGPETLAAVRDAGLLCACSSDSAGIWRGADMFRLPRLLVRDWAGDRFGDWLERQML
jgi:peptidoglycan/xylan/chitin deacetylase (PgdA/CDA1 family)